MESIPPVTVSRDWIDYGIFGLTAVLAGVGVFGTWIALDTLRQIRDEAIHTGEIAEAVSKSADALIASQRAQLAVAPDNPIPDINAGNSPKVRVEVTNRGITPAHGCVCETWIEILPEPFTDFTPKAVYHKLPAPMTIYAGAPNPTVIELWLNRSVTPAELSGLKSGHQLLCFRIRVEYKDALENKRWQEFGFVARSGGMEYLPKYNDSGQG